MLESGTFALELAIKGAEASLQSLKTFDKKT